MAKSAVVFLHRWAGQFADQARFSELVMRACEQAPDQVTTQMPEQPLTRRSRLWLRLRDTDPHLYTNGLITIAAKPAPPSHVATRVKTATGAEATPIELCRCELSDALARFSVWSSATLALDELATFDRQRPRWAGDFSPEDFAHLIRHPLLRYAAGIGAQRRTVGPWKRHTAEYRQRISEIAQFWDRTVIPCVEAAERSSALGPLFAPLGLMRDFGHDADIQAEYETRLAELAGQSERIAARVGAALSVATVVVGFYRLEIALIVGGVALLYFYGLIEVVHTLRRWLRRYRTRSHRFVVDAPLDSAEQSIAAAMECILKRPAAVLLGTYLAAIDFACGFGIWLDGVERHHDPERLIVTRELPEDDRSLIVIGGPLSVPARRLLDLPLCALGPSDASFSQWDYGVGGVPLGLRGGDDTIGCVSASRQGPTLFVDGFRGIGVELATAFVRRLIRGEGQPPAEPFVLLRYDSEEACDVVVPVKRKPRASARRAS